MSVEIQGLDQFASNRGWRELRDAAAEDEILTEFFDTTKTTNVPAVQKALRELAKTASKDVATTATGLADMLKDHKSAKITDGAGTYEHLRANTGRLKESIERRSLQHADHQRLIAPIARKVKKLIGTIFDTQGEAIVKAVEPWLKLHMKEAAGDDDADTLAQDILPDTLAPFVLNVTTAQAQDYRDLITLAIQKAEAHLEAELNSGASIPETAMSRYITDNSLEKLTGDFTDRTKQRLRNAIADSIRRGGTSADIIQSIRDTVDEFSEKRAEMIAQTEVNNAYSFGRDGLAQSAGLEEKNWITESDNPCPVCTANEDEGWIPIGQAFGSGDLFPTAHPLCACGCDYRRREKALPIAA